MKRIWKYTLEIEDEQTVLMPEEAVPLSVQIQHGEPQLWALVDSAMPHKARTFKTIGTGNPNTLTDSAEFIGTYQLGLGDLVFHVFEEPA